jgi:hypothetical protein
MADPTLPAPMWKRVLAPILDVIMVFAVGGYVIGAATGNLKPGGFELNGWPALLLYALIVIYFFVGRRLTRGTLWDRFFGISRPQPK